MRLYLNAKNQSEIAYTPDWVEIVYKKSDNSDDLATLTLDVRGTIEYDNGLNCRVKGDLVPWMYTDSNSEIDYCDWDEDEALELYSYSQIAQLLKNSVEVTVGIYPAIGYEDKEVSSDIFGVGKGVFEWIADEKIEEIEFRFITEKNY